MTNVENIRVIDPRNQANENAIEMVEDLLERLKSGESIDVAFVEVVAGRSVRIGVSGGGSYHLLNSGAARLAHQLASQQD